MEVYNVQCEDGVLVGADENFLKIDVNTIVTVAVIMLMKMITVVVV